MSLEYRAPTSKDTADLAGYLAVEEHERMYDIVSECIRPPVRPHYTVLGGCIVVLEFYKQLPSARRVTTVTPTREYILYSNVGYDGSSVFRRVGLETD